MSICWIIRAIFKVILTDRAGLVAENLALRQQLARSFLAGRMHYITASHTANDIAEYLAAVGEKLAELERSLQQGTLMADIEFQPSRPAFKRLA